MSIGAQCLKTKKVKEVYTLLRGNLQNANLYVNQNNSQRDTQICMRAEHAQSIPLRVKWPGTGVH